MPANIVYARFTFTPEIPPQAGSEGQWIRPIKPSTSEGTTIVPSPAPPLNLPSSLGTLLATGFLPQFGRHLADDLYSGLAALYQIVVAWLGVS